MPNCHHCGTNVNTAQKQCRTCGGQGSFCTICAWWELGPPDVLNSDMGDRVQELFTANENVVVVPCDSDDEPEPHEAAKALYDQCKLMTSQTVNVFWLDDKGHQIACWSDPSWSWEEAVAHAMTWLDTYLSEEKDHPWSNRMRAMLVTWLSAYELCMGSQVRRLFEDDASAKLSLHDISAVAAKHYRLHNGFDVSGIGLDLDVATLAHLDTIEQYVKGNMPAQYAAMFIRNSIANATYAANAVLNGGLLYAAILSVVRDYAKNKVPSPQTFSPADNKASGIYRKADIELCFTGGDTSAVSAAYQTKIRILGDAVRSLPDFQGQPFRFNSVGSNGVIDNGGGLSNAQKLYLESLPDLDDDNSPAACRTVVRQRVLVKLERFRAALAGSVDVTDWLTPIAGANFFSLVDAETLLEMLLGRKANGHLRLQTCANDVSFISNKRYEGILSIHASDITFAKSLAGCTKAANCNDTLTGSKYTKSEVDKAADTRKKSPFQYMSWRVQKDRMAHKFLMGAYSDYDVTAAVVQSFPYPEPQSTYGPQVIVWKSAILPFCTFKVGDSGRPTRSVLLLLDDLLRISIDQNSIFTKIALFNLLLQAFAFDNDTRDLLGDFIQNALTDFPAKRPRRGDDIEAHLYGNLRLADVDVIIYPTKANAAQQTKQTAEGLFGDTPLVLYDIDKYLQRDADIEGDEGGQCQATITKIGTLHVP